MDNFSRPSPQDTSTVTSPWEGKGIEDAQLPTSRLSADTDSCWQLKLLIVQALAEDRDQESLRQLRSADAVFASLSRLAGRALDSFIPHFIRIKPPITHLVLADDSGFSWASLRTLLLSLSDTLTSLSIRQNGTLDIAPGLSTSLRAIEVPHLKRLAIALDGELYSALAQFIGAESLETIELGTDDPDFTRLLVLLLTDTTEGVNWPKLTELSLTAPSVTAEDWTALSEACERRNVVFAPGFDLEGDWPEEYLV
ncbi:hypothetical protein P7C70_g201, partial [Phenoliferia sp. Uapishka_3]